MTWFFLTFHMRTFFTFDVNEWAEGTAYHDLAQLSISRLSSSSELVLGPHPRDVYTARLPPPEWKERESFDYKFNATRRRISLS